MATKIEPPFYPIIYVRGYAGSQQEVEDTVATPYMGFNLGATKLRQRADKEVTRHIFESPLVRLIKDHGYADAYHEGEEIRGSGAAPARSVFIYRYYDQVSEELGDDERAKIEVYAAGLSEFVLKVRGLVCGEDADLRAKFRVYLVAHSMGGLVCRCFLQNPKVGSAEAKGFVDKVFTYATPHNGIDLSLIGNVPGFLSRNNSRNFNRRYMREYLALPEATKDDGPVNFLNGFFPNERFFCLVGTSDRDYAAGGGAVRRVVGPMSDGLVRITSASLQGGPRAFVYRSHSGDYGIVNSESGYQNLKRFLFGHYRVDAVLEIDEITLPRKVEALRKKDKKIRASYHFESVVRVRGATWDLHRRLVDEESAVFRSYAELFEAKKIRPPHMFTLFLSSGARVNRRRKSLGFSVDVRVLVPVYEVNSRIWLDDHFDGGYLFRDKVNLELTPGPEFRVKYGFDSASPNRTTRDATALGDGVFEIPIEQRTLPGIRARLRLQVAAWS
jgi:hypothetical protein